MNDNKFPINVFHSEIQKTILNINKEYESNIDTIACQILTTMAFPLNNLYEVHLKKEWVIRPNLWLLHFEPSGSGKTQLLKMITKPIKAKQTEIKKNYQRLKAEFDNMPDYEPKNLTLFLSSYTPEGMHKLLSDSCNDGKAVILISDEISGIFKSFNQYSKGSGEEDFLQYYDYAPISKVRADRQNDINISESNVSIIGVTQPSKMFEILNPERIGNGNAFRWLFSVNEEINLLKNPFNFNDSDIDCMESFYTMMDNFLFDVEGVNLIDRKELILSTECKEYIKSWYLEIMKKDNIESALLKNIMGKMDAYLIKFAIVLNRTRTYFEDLEKDKYVKICQHNYNLSFEDMQNAAKLTEYFINNTITILNKVSDPSSRLFDNEKEKEIFENMPLSFTTKLFNDIYTSKGNMSLSSAKRLLKKYQIDKMIGRNKQGEYYKIVA